MTPMPVNPKVVVLVNAGSVVRERNNIGNDTTLVVTHTVEEFEKASAGVPYVAGTETLYASTRQTLAGGKKK